MKLLFCCWVTKHQRLVIKSIYFSTGGAKFCPKDENRISEDHFKLKFVTFWEEFIFVSNHSDAPKVILVEEQICLVLTATGDYIIFNIVGLEDDKTCLSDCIAEHKTISC